MGGCGLIYIASGGRGCGGGAHGDGRGQQSSRLGVWLFRTGVARGAEGLAQAHCAPVPTAAGR